MSIELISVVLVAALIVMLVMGQPLSWSLGAVAMIICLVQFPTLGPISSFVNRIFDMAQSSTLMAVPLFVMMASILQRSGVAESLFKAAYIWAGGLRGGLAIGTIFANIIMAAMVGVVGAEIITLGMVALPQMLKNRYDKTLSLGTLTAGGGLATLIPPSVVFIVYGMTASVSVAQLFTAGILPGLVLAFGYIGFIIFHCKRHPEAAPLPPEELRNMSWKAKLAVLKTLVLPLMITFGVLGSIYLGWATPNEAAGVGVVLVMISAAIMRTLTMKMFWEACLETVKVSCMLSWIFFGAQTVIGAYTLTGGTQFVRDTIIGMNLGVWGTLVLINLIWIFLGCFLDWMGILFLTIPIFLPVIQSFNLNPVWFGVLYCMNMQVSYLTPPFAPSSFYMKSITPPEITMMDIYKATMPFLLITLSVLVLVTVWHQLPLYLLK
ncbi:MAG: TRAP transporter large permease subunit [Deltaproteobacteria bacterium]|jgi:tripartite ATP-independent transporter DctM subunit|nr:TRAP transporter large permease subunit [Deltaproteobacteria bacterium]